MPRLQNTLYETAKWFAQTAKSLQLLTTITCICREGKEKCGTPARNRFDPDPAAVTFDDPLAQCQADAGAGVLFPGVKALKNDEQSRKLARINPDAVVAHRKEPLAVTTTRSNLNGRRMVAMELHRVSDEILEHLRELDAIGDQFG